MKRRSSQKQRHKRPLPRSRASADFGGGCARGNARRARSFRALTWMHISLRSEKAKANHGFLQPKNFLAIQKVIDQARLKHHIDIGDFLNAGTHLHLKIKASRRKDLQNFLRVITTLIARKITGARKGQAFGRFWDGLCYSRVLKRRGDLVGVTSFFHRARRVARKGLGEQRELLDGFTDWIAEYRRAHRGKLKEAPNLT